MVGDFIILRRKELGLKRKELAEKLDITYNYLNLIENNKRPLTDKLCKKLAEVLNEKVEVIKYYNTTSYGDSYKQEKKLIKRQIENISKEIADLEIKKSFLEREKKLLISKLAMVENTERQITKGEV